jgi:hypothetical protein
MLLAFWHVNEKVKYCPCPQILYSVISIFREEHRKGNVGGKVGKGEKKGWQYPRLHCQN